MTRVLGFGGMVALSVVIGAAAPAQEVAAIDFTALLDSCNAAPVECQAVLTTQITRIEALLVPKEVRTQYLQTLATVAAIAAQDNAGLAADMAAVVADVAETVAEGVFTFA